jgi:hypothetical protein
MNEVFKRGLYKMLLAPVGARGRGMGNGREQGRVMVSQTIISGDGISRSVKCDCSYIAASLAQSHI